MLRRSLSKLPVETINPTCGAYIGRCLSDSSGIAPQLSRGFSTAPAESFDTRDAEELVVRVPLNGKPTWGPGVAPPGREQRVGELWAAMEYHGRGTRKIKLKALHSLMRKISSKDELKYAGLGLQLFKKKEIRVTEATATLFVQACCRSGSPQTAVEMLSKSEMGLSEPGLVTANRFNFLLTQLYRAGDKEGLRLAVNEGLARGQVLDARSHAVIAKIEADEKAAALAKAEAERVAAEKAAAEKAAAEKAAAEKAAGERIEAESQLGEHAASSEDVVLDTQGEAIVEERAGDDRESRPGDASSPEGVGTEENVATSGSEESIEADKATSGSEINESR